MRAGCLIIVLQWQRKCWMCWQLISVGAGQKGLKSPLHSQLWAQCKYFSKIENTLFGNSPVNVGNVSACIWVPDIEGGEELSFTYIGQCGKHCLVSSYNEWSISELNWREREEWVKTMNF